VTEVEPLANYSAAASYDQHYFANNPNQGDCAAVIGPKLEKFQRAFKDKLAGRADADRASGRQGVRASGRQPFARP
jgi:hypothetical protein